MPGFVQGTFYEFLRDRAPPIGEIDHRDLEALDCGREEMNEPSLKVFELSHTLRDKWVTGEPDVRSRFLELVCLNWQLVDGELVYEIRKPFDVLAEGLNSAKSRGARTSVELFVVGLSELVATIHAI